MHKQAPLSLGSKYLLICEVNLTFYLILLHMVQKDSKVYEKM
jgi:hypothetical protein